MHIQHTCVYLYLSSIYRLSIDHPSTSLYMYIYNENWFLFMEQNAIKYPHAKIERCVKFSS